LDSNAEVNQETLWTNNKSVSIQRNDYRFFTRDDRFFPHRRRYDKRMAGTAKIDTGHSTKMIPA